MKTQLYKSAKNYLQGSGGMKNEVQMWYVAAGLLMQELAKRNGCLPFGNLGTKVGPRIHQQIKSAQILDLCSGPGSFVNHLLFVYPKLQGICLDTNQNFVSWGNKYFCKFGFSFFCTDAVTFKFRKKFSIITASSAYHHIDDKKKLLFIQNLARHLTKNGIIIMCENFLPGYETASQKIQAINKYYQNLRKYYSEGNANLAAQRAIQEVHKLEQTNTVEHKVLFDIFTQHLRNSGLIIDTDIPVWQPKAFCKDNAGSHVLILRKRLRSLLR